MRRLCEKSATRSNPLLPDKKSTGANGGNGDSLFAPFAPVKNGFQIRLETSMFKPETPREHEPHRWEI
jgi:hypothetical protein